MPVGVYTASGLINEYHIHKYSEEMLDFSSAALSVNLVPSEGVAAVVTVIGAPFTFRLICQSTSVSGCDLGLPEKR